MNKIFTYLALIVLPILLFVTAHILKEAQGPYYLNFYDPSYVYLINSLNLAQLNGYGVGHFDHPGTTVQVIGAFVVKFYHWISNGNVNIVTDVLSRPEDYLSVANKVFVIINCIVLFFLGLFIYKITNNLIFSLLIQFSPFASTEIFYGLIIVTPENFMISVILCLIGILIYYLFKVDDKVKPPLVFVIAFAIICGLGLATKINFLPLILIPIILIKGFKNKTIFVLLTFISFIIFIIPALSNFTSFMEWVGKLVLYSGHYGEGSATVINSSEFIHQFKLIFEKDKFFAASYFLTLISLILKLSIKPKVDPHYSNRIIKESKVLLAIFLAMTLQIILVAKQYRQHYMLPSFMLSIISLSLSASLLSVYFKGRLKKLKLQYTYLFLIIIISSWGLMIVVLSYNEGTQQRDEAFKMEKFIQENYSDAFVISTFGSANKQCALAFAVSYAGSQVDKYQSILSSIQPNHFFYNWWVNQFYSISNKSDIKNILPHHKKVILQITYTPYDFLGTFNKICEVKKSSLVNVFTNGNRESIYEIKIEK